MSEWTLGNSDKETVCRYPGAIISCVVDRVPVKFFVSNSKDPIQNHHLRGTFFEADELRLIAKHIRPGAAIADVGANIGNHAIFFEKFLMAKSVILFEINPDAISILKFNQLLNNCQTWDDSYLGYALSDRTGWMAKIVPDENNLGGTQFRESADGAFMSFTGDSVLASRRVEFIKMDIEGGEMGALAGLKETVARWRPTIFVELGDQYLSQFTAWLDAMSYEIVDKFERYIGLPNYLIKPVRCAR